jgi:hypothetical protein
MAAHHKGDRPRPPIPVANALRRRGSAIEAWLGRVLINAGFAEMSASWAEAEGPTGKSQLSRAKMTQSGFTRSQDLTHAAPIAVSIRVSPAIRQLHTEQAPEAQLGRSLDIPEAGRRQDQQHYEIDEPEEREACVRQWQQTRAIEAQIERDVD